jgi:hypothetical protein
LQSVRPNGIERLRALVKGHVAAAKHLDFSQAFVHERVFAKFCGFENIDEQVRQYMMY